MGPRRPPFRSNYAIFKTGEGKYRLVFCGDKDAVPPSFEYWLGTGKFLQTAAFSTPQMAQVFRHNHLDMTDRKALGLRAFPDSGVYEYGRVHDYPLEPA